MGALLLTVYLLGVLLTGLLAEHYLDTEDARTWMRGTPYPREVFRAAGWFFAVGWFVAWPYAIARAAWKIARILRGHAEEEEWR